MASSEVPESVPPEPHLATCLDLLRSSSDEKKFVGLLLVTKLTPTATADVLSAIYSAVGPLFLHRLLLPLKQDPNARRTGQEAAMVALGVVMWARLSAAPEVAIGEELEGCIPLLLKVARAGGVVPAMEADMGAALRDREEEGEARAAALASTADALACILAACLASGSARRVALESGALECAVAALRRAEREGPLEGEYHVAGVVTACRLVAALLPSRDRAGVLAAHWREVGDAVPLLARRLPIEEGLAGEIEPSQRRHAAVEVQLESLNALLCILPLPATHLEDRLRGTAHKWGPPLRTGLGQILRARAGVPQRLAALQLAAAGTALLGPRWLAAPDPAFLLLATTVARIEVGVLLLDALAPPSGIQVPDHGAASPSSTTRAFSAMDIGGGGGGGGGSASSSTSTGGWAVGDGGAASSRGASFGAVPKPGQTQERVDSVVVPTEMRWEGPHQTPQARATALLPACFEVIESAIEALADGEDEALPSPASSQGSEAGPGIDPATAAAVLTAVQEAVEGVLQYLEQVAGREGAARAPLTLAGVRLLGRFLAEAPLALSDRVVALLPFLLSCRSGEDGLGEGALFLLPTILQMAWGRVGGGASAPEAQAAWLQALASPPTLTCLVAHARACVEAARRAVTREALARADADLTFACRCLAPVLGVLGLRRDPHAALAEAGAAPLALLPALEALEAARPAATASQPLDGEARLAVAAAAAGALAAAPPGARARAAGPAALRLSLGGLRVLGADEDLGEALCRALLTLLDAPGGQLAEAARKSAVVMALLEGEAAPGTAWQALLERLRELVRG
uniref:Neurochondrin n=1 Tax=Auxenochlorella protothecoides TaxID=3075 RepID=A0A1D2ADU1_AUXPR